MLLHNSKVVNQSCTLRNASTSILFSARRDYEGAHCFVSSMPLQLLSIVSVSLMVCQVLKASR